MMEKEAFFVLRKRYSIHEIFKPHLNILNLTHKPIRPYSYFFVERKNGDFMEPSVEQRAETVNLQLVKI